MGFSAQLLAERLTALVGDARPARLAIALSGGADSAALAHAAAELAAEPARWRLRALHIDHGLTAAAPALGLAAESLARSLGLEFERHRVLVSDAAGEGPEAAARRARYAMLASLLANDEFLVTAHHQDDQAETLLVQLLRGAGLKGLAAMPALAPLGRGWLLRPLLEVPRAALTEYARVAGLQWCEDPMNADPRYDRGYLRRQVLPALLGRWPAAHVTLARASLHLASAQGLLDEDSAVAVAALARGPALSIAGLLELAAPRRAAVLRYWLASRGLASPPTRRLELIERELLRARGTGLPRMAWPGAELRAFAGLLYAFAPLPPLPPRQALALPGAGALELGLGALGRLRLTVAEGKGLALGRAAGLELAARSGGERLRLRAGAPRRALKDLLREARVPPWARGRLPLVHAGAALAAVVLPRATWVAAEFEAHGHESGLVLEWLEAPEELEPAPPAQVSPAGGFG